MLCVCCVAFMSSPCAERGSRPQAVHFVLPSAGLEQPQLSSLMSLAPSFIAGAGVRDQLKKLKTPVPTTTSVKPKKYITLSYVVFMDQKMKVRFCWMREGWRRPLSRVRPSSGEARVDNIAQWLEAGTCA